MIFTPDDDFPFSIFSFFFVLSPGWQEVTKLEFFARDGQSLTSAAAANPFSDDGEALAVIVHE